MNSYLFSFIAILLSFHLSRAETMEVEKQILKAAKEQVSQICQTCTVEVKVLNKQILDDIAIPDEVISDNWKGQTNLILKVGETERIVTVDIRWKDQVVVANSNIKQGQKITADNLRLVEKDVTYLSTAYLNDVSKAVGWIGRRLFQRGQVIDESQLKKPLAIRYGQPVKLEMKQGALYLTLNAKAQGAGAVGDSIPVYISKTRKKINAKIISKNTVRIE